jgi:tetratricopeptide (TPR) repeat protein
VYESDGSGTRESEVVAHIQSQAGLQSFAVLSFPYTSDNTTVDVEYVRVSKPDGTVVVTPEYNVQDMPGEVTRTAPMYSDLHEKHVVVKALSVGDVLEYKTHTRITKPQVPGQFWSQHDFMKLFLVKEEELVLNVPREKYVQVETPNYKPQVQDEGARKIYTWKTSNLSLKGRDDLVKRREVPPPTVQLTTFRSWGEVGRWYDELQRPQLAVTPQLQAKAAELVKGLATDDEKIRAIYYYVSLHFHYVSLSFGVGRYQPHPAEDVLENEYGDCKDKHTLLATLLKAAGFDAWPALINSTRKIDPAVPSPGQFDHVITAVPRGSTFIWLDTTPEVAPFGLLTATLRDKQALVIPADKPSSLDPVGSLMTTPSQPPFPMLQSAAVEGNLDSDGTFTAHVQLTQRGDTELLYRLAFRGTPQAQWKQLTQGISYREGFGGEVTDPKASPPDEPDKPFTLKYDYKKKSYGDWDNHRIVAPLPWFGIEGSGSDDKKPTEPVVLGGLGEVAFTSKTKLPEGYAPKYSDKLDLSEDFADYHAEYSIANGVLTANRKLIVKKSEVPVSSWDAYKKFCKALSDERDRYINLQTAASEYPEGEGPKPTPSKPEGADSSSNNGRVPVRKTGEQLGEEARQANPEAGNLMQQAAQAWQRQDYTRADELARQVSTMDPQFFGVHTALGLGYLMRNDPDKAINEFRKELEYHPENPGTYYIYSQVLVRMHHQDEAVAVLRQWLAVDPANVDAALGLQSLLIKKNDYAGALNVLTDASRNSPDSPALQFALASAYFKTHQIEQGEALLRKAIAGGGGSYNDAAYMLANANVDLALAGEYAEKALASANEKSLDADTDDQGYSATYYLAGVWDTLGWVYFRRGMYSDALPYLRSAWLLSQDPTDGYHLGQLYEKLGKTQDAIHTYKLALSSPGSDHDDIRKRYDQLTNHKGGDPGAPTLRRGPGGAVPSAGEELSRMRTFRLATKSPPAGSAIFTVVFSPGKVDSVRYQMGDEPLKSLADQIAVLKFNTEFPNSTPAKVFRRGMLVCGKIAGCDFVLMLPDSVHAVDSQSPAN